MLIEINLHIEKMETGAIVVGNISTHESRYLFIAGDVYR
jgi:hypothetical protein